MITLNENYKRNIAILKENMARGMTQAQASAVIRGMQAQFERAGLYDNEARAYIEEMQATAGIKTIKAVDMARDMGIEVVEN